MASVQTMPKQKVTKVKAVYQKRKLFRANEPLLSVFMWGINHTVSELNHVTIPVMLMPDDFKAYTKVRVDNHLFNKENMLSHFKVKEYCPIVFRNLRERLGIDDQDYLNSLTKQPHCIDSPGRSSVQMLLSHDRRYFIKTLVTEEVEQMHHLLKQYHQMSSTLVEKVCLQLGNDLCLPEYLRTIFLSLKSGFLSCGLGVPTDDTGMNSAGRQHIVESHANTLLPHYLGMYRITVSDVETYFIVMRNVFSPRVPIHKKYDLKGSTVDRCASEKEKAKKLPTYKDNDFLTDGAKILIGKEAKENLMACFTADVQFLTNLHLMDYSLIVGIHDCEQSDSFGIDVSVLNTDSDEPNSGEDEPGLEFDVENLGGYAPTPPDSPQPNCNLPPFDGDIDRDIERFGIKSMEGGPKKEVYFLALIDILTRYNMKKRTAQAAKTMKHGSGAEISTVHPEQYAKRFLDFIDKCIE